MAREPEARLPGPPQWAQRLAPAEDVALVVLAAASVALVLVGVAHPGGGAALAAGSLAGALALVLVARRSMEAFVLLVLVLRPALDGLHAPVGVAATDPARVLGLLFVAVSLVWWGARWIEGRRHPTSATGMALVAFLVVAALATLGSEAPGHSAAEVARFGTAILMFFVVDRLCEDTGRPDRVLGAVLAAAVVPVAVALLGPLVGVHRTEVKDRIERAISTFTQSNPFGHFLTITVLVLVAVALVRPGRTRLAALAALVPVALTLGLTYTRLAWAAAVVGVLVMLWLAGKRRVVPVVVVVLLALAVLSPAVSHRIDQLTTSNPTVVGSESGVAWRWSQWADVARMSGTNPVTGIGPGVVELRLVNHQPPHNDYLKALTETGVLGLLAFVATLTALVGVAVGAHRRAVGVPARTIALAFGGVVSGLIVASGAANLLGQVVILWYVYALAAAAAWVGRHGEVRTEPGHPVTRLAPPVRHDDDAVPTWTAVSA
jgi:putative inorganic carbon (HCO3(-)) transporter